MTEKCYYCKKQVDVFGDRISILFPENDYYAVALGLTTRDVCIDCRKKHLKRLYPRRKARNIYLHIEKGKFVQISKEFFLDCIQILKGKSENTIEGMLEVFERMNSDVENITIDYVKPKRRRRNENK